MRFVITATRQRFFQRVAVMPVVFISLADVLDLDRQFGPRDCPRPRSSDDVPEVGLELIHQEEPTEKCSESQHCQNDPGERVRDLPKKNVS